MKLHAPSLLSAGLVILVVFPVFGIGFLADDFYMGERMAARAAEEPGVIAAVRDAFVHRWTDHFDVFRPLTILSLRLDYAVFGVDGGAHHVTNVLLWLLCAFLFADVAARVSGGTGRWWRAGWVLLFGAWPAAIETVGWLVAREDLFCALFGLLALRTLLVRPDRPARVAIVLVGAYLAKETSVVLPLVLLCTDFALDPAGVGGGIVRRALVMVRRHAWSLGLLVAYFAVRYALFGKIGGDYNGKPYSAFLKDEGAVARIFASLGDCFVRLAAPVNDYAWRRVFGGPSTWALIALPLVAGVILFCGFRHRRPGDLRVPLAASAWFFGPLTLLVVPLDGVGAGMEKSRFLLIPAVGWCLTLAVALVRAVDAGGRTRAGALAAAGVLVVSGSLLWRLDLSSYEKASDRVELVLGQIRDQMEPGSGCWLLRTGTPADPHDIHHELSVIEGCHVLSAALFHANLPPYVADPGITVQPITDDVLDTLPDLLRPARTRPYIAYFVPSNLGGPEIRVLAKASSWGGDQVLTPDHDASVPDGWTPRFEISGPRAAVARADNLRVIVVEPLGNRAVAELPFTPPAEGADTYSVAVDGTQMQVWRGDVETEYRLEWPVLDGMPYRYFIWWAEFRRGEDLLVRSQYRVVRLPE